MRFLIFIVSAFILAIPVSSFCGPPPIPLPVGLSSDGSSGINVTGSGTFGTPNTTEDTTGSGVEVRIENDASEIIPVGGMKPYLFDETDGTEDGIMVIPSLIAGTEYTSGVYFANISLADGGKILFPTGLAGYGSVSAPEGAAAMQFTFIADGTINTINTPENCSETEDNDTTLNVYDAGSGIGINNELGSTQTVVVFIICTKSGDF